VSTARHAVTTVVNPRNKTEAPPGRDHWSLDASGKGLLAHRAIEVQVRMGLREGPQVTRRGGSNLVAATWLEGYGAGLVIVQRTCGIWPGDGPATRARRKVPMPGSMRTSAMFSVVASGWPAVKTGLRRRLDGGEPGRWRVFSEEDDSEH
jgi:hypothetical protein